MAKLIAKCALERKESRGAHFRTDFKEQKEEFAKISIVKYEKEQDIISYEDAL
ncbi:hypothetical protein [Arcobacter caeni]